MAISKRFNSIQIRGGPVEILNSLIVDFGHRRKSYKGKAVSPSPNAVKKSVVFDSCSFICIYERPEESYSSNMSYSKEEIYAMKKANQCSVMEASEALHEASSMFTNDSNAAASFDRDTLTGIENLLTPALFKRTRASQVNCVRAVLKEQARQALTGEYDPVKIARKSRTHSIYSKTRALKVAFYQSKNIQ